MMLLDHFETMSNKVFQHSLHRELWQWLAEHPRCDKEDWVRWKSNGGTIVRPISSCYACEYTKNSSEIAMCNRCPIHWNGYECIADAGYSEYEQWLYARTPQERTRLALVIRDLPVRSGVVCE